MRLRGVGDNVVDRYADLGRMFPGGNALNVAVAARRAGAAAAYLGAVGTDRAGDVVLSALHAEDVDVQRVRRVEGPNAYADVTVVDGDRVFVGGNATISRFWVDADDLAYLEQLEFADLIPGVSLDGYGAVRNLGLLWAQVLGHDWCVFVDDDQVVLDRDFLQCASDGLGAELPDGSKVLAKSGYYVDREGRYQVKDAAHWSDTFWRRADAFNRALSIVDAPPRMRVSTVAFGGCLALHRELTEKVSFDPWVFRGEDIDYVINARLHGYHVYLDGDWRILHQPPDVPSESLKFRQSGFSFIYGHR
jgi:hypothetical protein